MKRKKRLVRPIRRLSASGQEVLEKWEEGLEAIGAGFGSRSHDLDRDAYDQADSFAKREIYRLVNSLTDNRYRGALEHALLYKLQKEPRLPFALEPYFWALKAADGDEGISLGDDKVLNYGKILRYAAMHHIPPELLEGFAHQVGGIAAIKEKLKEGKTEVWLTQNLAWIAKS